MRRNIGLWFVTLPVFAFASPLEDRDRQFEGMSFTYRISEQHFQQAREFRSAVYVQTFSNFRDGLAVNGNTGPVTGPKTLGRMPVHLHYEGKNVVLSRYDLELEAEPRFYVGEIIKEASNSYKYAVALAPNPRFWPHELAIFGNKGVIGLYGLSPKFEARERGKRVVYTTHEGSRQKIRAFGNPWRFEIDINEDGSIQTVRSYQFKTLTTKTTVTAWKDTVRGRIPKVIMYEAYQLEDGKPLVAQRIKYDLTSVSIDADVPKIPIPIGGEVFDYRPHGEGIPRTEWPIRNAKPIRTLWTGRIPSGDGPLPTSAVSLFLGAWPYLAFGGLLVVGLVIVIRSRRLTS
ncbi:MAG: hypothetical protein SFX74_08030 [Fimbriimonadaceae bacterium]|nr:hypothetical protein [Fimbriimonadaceae bacterium]